MHFRLETVCSRGGASTDGGPDGRKNAKERSDALAGGRKPRRDCEIVLG